MRTLFVKVARHEPNTSLFLRQKADVLYILFSSGEKATAAVELNDDILLRFNRAEKKSNRLNAYGFFHVGAINQVRASPLPFERLARA
ncbi:MAG: DUF2283 domain-containing protein [bacterium]